MGVWVGGVFDSLSRSHPFYLFCEQKRTTDSCCTCLCERDRDRDTEKEKEKGATCLPRLVLFYVREEKTEEME